MAIKKYKPITNGRRNMTSLDFAEITKTTPEKSLLKPLPKKAGRNNQGKLTVRHHGGDTNVNTVLSISNVTKMVSMQKLILFNMIQTAQQTSL